MKELGAEESETDRDGIYMRQMGKDRQKDRGS